MYNKIIIGLTFIILCACTGRNNVQAQTEQQSSNTEQQRQLFEEQQTQARLRAKADTALQFCRKKGLNTNICMLVDMSLHSGKNRFFVWDFTKDTVTHWGLCCHGYGLGGTQVKPVFSNVSGSYCSSLGKYKTGVSSYSNWGIHVHYKLHGLDSSNSNAFRRWVVLHSYSYVPEREIYPDHLPLGYSQGCPVIDDKLMTTLHDMLQKSTKPMLLWIYNN